MAEDQNLEIAIGAKDETGSTLDKVADNLANLQNIAEEFSVGLKTLNKSLESSQKALAGIGTSSQEATKEIKAANKGVADDSSWSAIQKQLDDTEARYKSLARTAVTFGGQAKDALSAFSTPQKEDFSRKSAGVNPSLGADIKAEQAHYAAIGKLTEQSTQKMVAEFRKRTAAQEKELAQQTAAEQRHYATVGSLVDRNSQQMVAEFRKRTAEAEKNAAAETRAQNLIGNAVDANMQRVVADFRKRQAAEEKAAAASVRANNAIDGSLANMRYAMHDVSMTAGLLGTAITAGSATALKTVADYETAIADIQRTSEMTSAQAAELRDSFVDLASDVPVAFDELGRIGELGGQLNIPQDRLVDFTKTVAQFGATTDVTIDAAATAFGRLDNLLPDVQGNYDALGSSILQVGINSVATESEIIATTSQIAAAGSQAGLSADQVIGLSAAFASLGVAPEAARGTVIRVLGLMNAAVAEGGDALEQFAQTAGISAQEFSNTWGSPEFSNTFVSFLQGIGDEGQHAQLALKDLGIWAARDQNALLKLSQNTEQVSDMLGQAAYGFDNTNILADQFAIKAQTLSGKLQILVNNFTNLVAQSSELSGGVLGGVVDTLNGILEVATQLADNPLAQWIVTSYGALVALSGVALLASSAFGRMFASSLALRPAMDVLKQKQTELAREITIVNRAAAAQGVELTKLQALMVAAGQKAKGFGTVLKGALGVGAIGVAIGLAGSAITSIMDSLRSNVDKARESMGNFSAIMQAAQKDVDEAVAKYGSLDKALADSNSGLVEVNLTLDRSSGVFRKAESAIQDAASTQEAFKGKVVDTNAELENQTIILGRNALAQFAADLKASNDDLGQSLVALQAQGLNLDEFMNNLATGNSKAAEAQLKAISDAAYASLDSFDQNGKVSKVMTQAYMDLESQLKDAREAMDAADGALGNIAIDQALANSEIFQAAGALDGSAGAMGDTEAAAESLKQTIDALSGQFSELKDQANLGQSMVALIEQFGGAAIAGDLMGGAIINSVDDIEGAVSSAIKSGAAMGYTAAESVTALFAQLKQEGVDTAALLAGLQGLGLKNLGGVSFSTITKGMSGATSSTSNLSNYFGQLANNARIAGDSAEQASGGIDKAGKAAEEAAKEVRTLSDYAGDLSGVWKRAFDLRFSVEEARDAIHNAYQDIRDSMKESAERILDLKNKVQDSKDKIKEFSQTIRELKSEGKSLAADKALQEYFLSVAKLYNDDLAKTQISAKIGEIDEKIAQNKDKLAKAQKDQRSAASDAAKTEKELKEAQKDQTTTLEGNSKQAIKNREIVRNLTQDYQKQLQALADTGMSQADLERKSKQLRDEFVRQLTQMGFNRDEVGKYAKAFDDMAYAINRVPRNVTVKANVNPAIQAFQEFADKAAASAKKAQDSTTKAMDNIRKKASGGVSFPVRSQMDNTALINQFQVMLQGYQIAAKTAPPGFAALGFAASAAAISALINRLRAGFAGGGFTGRGGKYEVAGAVHKGEYVIPKEGVDQSSGMPNAGWVMRNLMNTNPGADSSTRISNMTTINKANSAGTQRVMVVNPVDLGIASLHAINNMGGDVVIGDKAVGAAAARSNVKNNNIGAA